MSQIIWQSHLVVAKGFLNPDHDMVYLSPRNHDQDVVLIVSTEDMATIIAKMARRRLIAKHSPAPSNDDLPF